MSWPMVKLGEVAPSKPIKKIEVLNTESVWQLNLDMVESHSGKVISKLIAPLSEAGSSTHWFDERYVLYSKLRPYLNKVVLPDMQGLATTELVPMLPDPKRLDRGYLAHYLRSNRFVSWISEQVAGAKMPRVSMKVFWDHEIPLPPLDEQKRIAAILDKADAIRQKRKQAIALADEFLRSVFLEMFGDPVTNPKGWEVKCLGELTTKPISYGILKPEEHDSNGVPMLRIQDLKRNSIQCENLHLVSNQLSQQYKRTILLGGELVISLVGTIGLVAKIPETLKGANVHRNLGVIDVKNKNLSEYLLVLMQMKEFKVILEKVTKGGVHKLLNLSDLKEVALPIPSDAELVRFKDVFMKEMRIKGFQNTQVLNEDMIFNSLSQKAFSGQL